MHISPPAKGTRPPIPKNFQHVTAPAGRRRTFCRQTVMVSWTWVTCSRLHGLRCTSCRERALKHVGLQKRYQGRRRSYRKDLQNVGPTEDRSSLPHRPVQGRFDSRLESLLHKPLMLGHGSPYCSNDHALI